MEEDIALAMNSKKDSYSKSPTYNVDNVLCFTAITNTSTITQTITGPLVKNTTFATNLFGSFVRTAIWSVGPLENFEFTNITRMNARVNKVALNLIH